MPTTDKRIDAYIANSAEFAKPILRSIRETVHEACPEVEETIKWSMPFFMYKGILCSMASFKQHCALHFWKGDAVVEDKSKSDEAMGQFGRITSVKDLPPKRTLIHYIKKAKQLHDDGVKPARPAKPRDAKEELVIPTYFTAALKKNKRAHTVFEAFPYSKRKDYVQWVAEAKTDETRDRRLQTSVEWLAEGKSRNWKYERC
jgi:uncharacterized protein YdeI (YjbR/CyaY-like superfamily)